MEKEYHFIEEIREQPAAIKKSLETADPVIKNLARRYTDKIERIVLVGCGDPHMLSLGAVYAFEQWAHIPAEAIEAAEFSMYRHELVSEHTLVILITSSGKTVKVIDAARLSKQRGALMFALTNLVPSPITEETSDVIQTQAGWSDSFPTKQTTSALAVLYALALHLAEIKGSMPEKDILALKKELYERLPLRVQEALKLEPLMKELANKYLDAPIYAFIGSGPNWVTALLAAAKMKETSQSRSEATNLEEYAHLHCLSLRENDLVFIITSPGSIGERNRLVCQHIEASGGKLVVVGPSQELDSWQKLNVTYCQVPDHNELFGPIIAWIPLQLFAYYVAVGKQRNPDRPVRHGPMDYLQKIIYTSMLDGWDKR